MNRSEADHFIALRKSLTTMREGVDVQSPLQDWQRDIVMIAQAEALCDLAATMNLGISVDVSE